MTWLIFALLGVLTQAIMNLLQRSLMKEDGASALAHGLVYQMSSSALVLIIALVHGFRMTPFDGLWLNYIILTIGWGGGTYCLFHAMSLLESSEVTIITSSRTIWAIIFALLFLGETFTAVNALGVVLILSSVVIILYQKDKIVLNRGAVYALLAAVFYGIGFANDAYFLRVSDTLSYAFVAYFLPGIFLFFTKPSVVYELKELVVPKTLWKMSLLSVMSVACTITIYLAYQYGGPMSLLSPIEQSVVVVTVILAAIFLKERDRLPRKLAGAVLAVIGVILLR